MNNPFVAVLMGSASDQGIMQNCFDQLHALNIPFEANILSAHRTPNETIAYIQDAQTRGCQVFIAAAGMAAHLAGAVAAQTTKPVIGVPLPGGLQHGLDALLSTVQMPGGTPVACMAVGSAGAKNAAVFAAQILAINNNTIEQQLLAARQQKSLSLSEQNQALKKAL